MVATAQPDKLWDQNVLNFPNYKAFTRRSSDFASPTTHLHLIMDRVAALRLPAIYDFPETAEEGGFAAYGPRLDDVVLEVMLRQIVQLFSGIKVADIPVEQPTKFELVINLKTAKALGLMIPESFLVRADKVIE